MSSSLSSKPTRHLIAPDTSISNCCSESLSGTILCRPDPASTSSDTVSRTLSTRGRVRRTLRCQVSQTSRRTPSRNVSSKCCEPPSSGVGKGAAAGWEDDVAPRDRSEFSRSSEKSLTSGLWPSNRKASSLHDIALTWPTLTRIAPSLGRITAASFERSSRADPPASDLDPRESWSLDWMDRARRSRAWMVQRGERRRISPTWTTLLSLQAAKLGDDEG
mmetsp:Transcript_14/g.28  ORF Transcript_14/g.28 Transcript_14/m.28 type:complete len:219 (-) Transcript_14:267-923(-)